jgi:hypothetical protein
MSSGGIKSKDKEAGDAGGKNIVARSGQPSSAPSRSGVPSGGDKSSFEAALKPSVRGHQARASESSAGQSANATPVYGSGSDDVASALRDGSEHLMLASEAVASPSLTSGAQSTHENAAGGVTGAANHPSADPSASASVHDATHAPDASDADTAHAHVVFGEQTSPATAQPSAAQLLADVDAGEALREEVKEDVAHSGAGFRSRALNAFRGGDTQHMMHQTSQRLAEELDATEGKARAAITDYAQASTPEAKQKALQKARVYTSQVNAITQELNTLNTDTEQMSNQRRQGYSDRLVAVADTAVMAGAMAATMYGFATGGRKKAIATTALYYGAIEGGAYLLGQPIAKLTTGDYASREEMVERSKSRAIMTGSTVAIFAAPGLFKLLPGVSLPAWTGASASASLAFQKAVNISVVNPISGLVAATAAPVMQAISTHVPQALQPVAVLAAKALPESMFETAIDQGVTKVVDAQNMMDPAQNFAFNYAANVGFEGMGGVFNNLSKLSNISLPTLPRVDVGGAAINQTKQTLAHAKQQLEQNAKQLTQDVAQSVGSALTNASKALPETAQRMAQSASQTIENRLKDFNQTVGQAVDATLTSQHPILKAGDKLLNKIMGDQQPSKLAYANVNGNQAEQITKEGDEPPLGETAFAMAGRMNIVSRTIQALKDRSNSQLQNANNNIKQPHITEEAESTIISYAQELMTNGSLDRKQIVRFIQMADKHGVKSLDALAYGFPKLIEKFGSQDNALDIIELMAQCNLKKEYVVNLVLKSDYNYDDLKRILRASENAKESRIPHDAEIEEEAYTALIRTIDHSPSAIADADITQLTRYLNAKPDFDVNGAILLLEKDVPLADINDIEDIIRGGDFDNEYKKYLLDNLGVSVAYPTLEFLTFFHNPKTDLKTTLNRGADLYKAWQSETKLNNDIVYPSLYSYFNHKIRNGGEVPENIKRYFDNLITTMAGRAEAYSFSGTKSPFDAKGFQFEKSHKGKNDFFVNVRIDRKLKALEDLLVMPDSPLSKKQRTVAHHLVENKHTLTSLLSRELPLPHNPLRAVEVLSDQVAHVVTYALPSHRQIELGASIFSVAGKTYPLKQLAIGLPTETTIPKILNGDIPVRVKKYATHFHPDHMGIFPSYGLSEGDIKFSKENDTIFSSVNSKYGMVTFEPQSDATTPYGGKITTHASRENVVLPKYFIFPENNGKMVSLKTADYLHPDSAAKGVRVSKIDFVYTGFTIASFTTAVLIWSPIVYSYVREKIENSNQ